MVLLTPLLYLLHRRYGRPCTVLGSGPWLRPLLAGHPDVERVLCVAGRKRPYCLDPTQRRLVAQLRSHPLGPVYVCDDYAVDKLRWLLQRAGVPDAACVFANPDCLFQPGEHWVSRWHRFGASTPRAFAGTRPADAADRIAAPRLVVKAADRQDLDAWLEQRALASAPLVLLQPGNKRTLKRGRAGALGDDKQWPRANWTRLIQRLLAEPEGYRIVLCGAPPEAAFLAAIAATVRSPRVLAAGAELPLRRLLALCERACAMISIDSGPAHAAAALGCPLIVLYGAQPPSRWQPRSPSGSPVIALGGLPERDHVAAVSLAEVIAAWRRLHRRTPTVTSVPPVPVRACSPS
jgi:heptosyltransferase-2/heptosyltransferase-3